MKTMKKTAALLLALTMALALAACSNQSAGDNTAEPSRNAGESTEPG